MIGTRWPNHVTVGGFVADVEEPGRWRVTTQVDGWTTSAGVRSKLIDRAGQDGAYDATSTYSARVIDLSGSVSEPSDWQALDAAEALASLSVRDLIELAVDNATQGRRSCKVRVTVAADIVWIGSQQFTWTLQVTAPDPLKYGPARTTSTGLEGSAGGTGLVFPTTFPLDFGVPPGVVPGSMSLPNVGKATYWPTIRLSGPVPNPKVTLNNTGDFVRLGFTLTASQWVDIDCANRSVLLNGQNSLAKFVTFSGNWLAVPPGGASISWTADAADPAASMTVSHYEGAWL